MSLGEAFDQGQQTAPFFKSLFSQSVCKNNFGEHIVDGRKEGKKGGRGKKVIITLLHDEGRFQF